VKTGQEFIFLLENVVLIGILGMRDIADRTAYGKHIRYRSIAHDEAAAASCKQPARPLCGGGRGGPLHARAGPTMWGGREGRWGQCLCERVGREGKRWVEREVMRKMCMTCGPY
jgi:hypothetical protein